MSATLQEQILRAFLSLTHLRGDRGDREDQAAPQPWGGALILNCGLAPASQPLAFASNIVGALCLSLEPDATILHQALRSGACDFVVNTADEALRALKNEARKHTPLSVGLHASIGPTLASLHHRGLRPDLLTLPNSVETPAALPEDLAAPLASFRAQGVPIGLPEAPPPAPGLTLRSFTFEDAASLRAFDTTLLSLIPETDRTRRQWLLGIARVLPRARPPQRLVYLTESESEAVTPRPAASLRH